MTEENYTGVTTGTVATACSLAAIDAILDSPDIVCVTVETPKKSLDILIDSCSKLSDTSACAVAHKNPYNDPDVTVNLAIVAHVELIDFKNEKVIITGGEGVGKITKPGLQIPVGEYAINPRTWRIRSPKVNLQKSPFPSLKVVKLLEKL